MNISRLALLLLVVAPVVFAAGPIDLTFTVPIMAIIVIIFLALVNMLSHSISNPTLDAWGKTEMRELLAGVILIFIIIMFFVGSSGISIALTGTNDYITSSLNIIDSWIQNYDSAYTLIIKAAARIRIAATYSPYISVSLWWVAPNYATNPLAGIGMILNSLSMGTQALTNAIYLFEGVRLLILFLKVTVPHILLPMAFVLRLIPFTRKTGNTLIAVSIAAMVFFPFSVILADTLNHNINFPHPNMDVGELDAQTGIMDVFAPLCELIPIRFILLLNEYIFGILVCLPLLLGVVTAPAYPACAFVTVPQVVYPIMMMIIMGAGAALLIPFEIYFSAGGASSYANSVFDQVHPFLRDVNNLVLVGYLDLILIAMITIVGARSLSAALGGEWYLGGIQRLI